jgi:hypothetical protein
MAAVLDQPHLFMIAHSFQPEHANSQLYHEQRLKRMAEARAVEVTCLKLAFLQKLFPSASSGNFRVGGCHREAHNRLRVHRRCDVCPRDCVPRSAGERARVQGTYGRCDNHSFSISGTVLAIILSEQRHATGDIGGHAAEIDKQLTTNEPDRQRH